MAEWIQQSVLNINAPALIVPVSSRVNFRGYNVINLGTAGSLVLNDAATLAQASTANQFINTGTFSASTNVPINPKTFKWPLMNGLVVSQMPTGMVIAVVYEVLFP